MSTIIKYHNDINKLAFSNFDQADFNLFFAICSQIEDMDTTEVQISYMSLRSIAGINKKYSIDDFEKVIDGMAAKLDKMDFKLIKGSEKIRFVFFPIFHLDTSTQILTVSINKYASYLLNRLAKEFTVIELQQFVNLNGKYSKSIYRLLKQYKHTGMFKINIEDFKTRIDVPQNYNGSKIIDKIIKPSLKDLNLYFDNLTFEVIHAALPGRPVTGFSFTFNPEKIRNKNEVIEKKILTDPDDKREITDNDFSKAEEWI